MFKKLFEQFKYIIYIQKIKFNSKGSQNIQNNSLILSQSDFWSGLYKTQGPATLFFKGFFFY